MHTATACLDHNNDSYVISTQAGKLDTQIGSRGLSGLVWLRPGRLDAATTTIEQRRQQQERGHLVEAANSYSYGRSCSTAIRESTADVAVNQSSNAAHSRGGTGVWIRPDQINFLFARLPVPVLWLS